MISNSQFPTASMSSAELGGKSALDRAESLQRMGRQGQAMPSAKRAGAKQPVGTTFADQLAGVSPRISTSLFKRETDIEADIKQHPKRERLWKAAQEMESFMVKMMLSEMRSSLPGTRLTQKNRAEEVFEDMLYDERAKSMAKGGQYGIARPLYDQMKDFVG